ESLILRERAEIEAALFLSSDGEVPRIDETRPKLHCIGERPCRDRLRLYVYRCTSDRRGYSVLKNRVIAGLCRERGIGFLDGKVFVMAKNYTRGNGLFPTLMVKKNVRRCRRAFPIK